jgi:hypothetical protein
MKNRKKIKDMKVMNERKRCNNKMIEIIQN